MTKEPTSTDAEPKAPAQPDEPANESQGHAALDGVRKFAGSLSAALKAALSTPEAEAVLTSAEGVAASAGREVDQATAAVADALHKTEGSDTGGQLKRGAATLLSGASGALSRAADALDGPPVSAPDTPKDPNETSAAD